MAVTREDIIRTARLARLRLDDHEIEALAVQLNRVFDYINQLHEVDTVDVAPLHHVLDMYNVIEEDTPHSCLTREAALANAPDRTEEFFRLPRVVH